MDILNIEGLKTHFFTDAGVARAVDGVSLDVPAGRTVALVGESGCGKSVTALSILRLVPEPPGRIVEGSIRFKGEELVSAYPGRMRELRGNAISMIFQEPMTSLNPVFRIGGQIQAVLRLHRNLDKAAARARAVELLDKVGIPAPDERVESFPHELSGGMRQRAMIAMALACEPELLIADEPTTALDVTIQAQILELLRGLQQEMGMTMLLITHDLGVVAETAHLVAIMYAGKVVEHATTQDLFNSPKHPYTAGLFASLPDVEPGRGRLSTIPGRVPPATDFPAACRFHTRCPFAMDICKEKEPAFRNYAGDGLAPHGVACWLHEEEGGGPRTAVRWPED